MENVNLQQVIDTDILQKIQDSFGESTGLAAVTVDYRGKPITKYSNFSPFCNLIREDKRCSDRCYQCDAYGGLEAARNEQPYIYRCHTGLVDFAIPIIVKGQLIGSVLCGQAKVQPCEEYDQLEHIVKETTAWRDNDDIVKAYNEIPFIPYEKIVSSAQLMFLVVNYMVEKDLMRYVQEELHAKDIKLIEQMKVRSDLEKELKEREMKALQLQINPHFLLNVLNTISRLAIIEGAERTQDMVFTLSEILQYVFEHINESVTIEDEIAHIERYLRIQLMRFGERISYDIEVPDEMHELELPTMILQAIVDNAIIHGLEPKDGNGRVEVTGYVVNDDAIIEVSDDGIGISDEKINCIDEGNCTLYQTKGIGLGIVNMILCYHYGQAYKLSISRNENGGTTVKIRIPIKSRGVMNAESALGR